MQTVYTRMGMVYSSMQTVYTRMGVVYRNVERYAQIMQIL